METCRSCLLNRAPTVPIEWDNFREKSGKIPHFPLTLVPAVSVLRQQLFALPQQLLPGPLQLLSLTPHQHDLLDQLLSWWTQNMLVLLKNLHSGRCVVEVYGLWDSGGRRLVPLRWLPVVTLNGEKCTAKVHPVLLHILLPEHTS